MGWVPGTRAARRAASAITCSPALSHSTMSRGLVTSGVEYSGCAWSTYSRAPLVRMTLAIPASSSRSLWSSACVGERSKPRASRSGDSSSKSQRGRRGVGASATAQAFTTWLDNVVGFAVGCPGTEMPYSTSVPMTRRTLMTPTLGATADQEDERVSAPPPLGLLLDVDGPVASPVTRTVAAPLIGDLARLLAAGIPVVLNTGRSSAFVTERVLTPLVDTGLPPGARLHAVCEKGGVWTTAGSSEVHEDAALRVPRICSAVVTGLVGDGYGDAMFVDTTKRTMATVEARTDVPSAFYAERQRAFDAELLARLAAVGLGVRLRDDRRPDADGRTPWRIAPSVIATDVESVRAGKAIGVRRALDLLRADGPLPRVWHTVGDSRSDYAMGDQLHALGDDVTHVDVGPEPPLDRPYPVRTIPGATYDAAGEAHLRELAARLT